MIIALRVDDSCIPQVSGESAAMFILQAVKDDPTWWVAASDSVSVSGPFGVYTEDREDARGGK